MCDPVPSALRAVFIATLVLGSGPVAALPGADDVVRIERSEIDYREPGEFLRGTVPVNGPLTTIRVERPFDIMKRHVTRGEYQACVDDRACMPLAGNGEAALPVVGVNWNDATEFANWLSRKTGQRWRLPTDREWALAAGSRYHDDAYTEVSDPSNPARRWIALYEAESARQDDTLSPAPKPIASFGENEYGVLDLSGNIWDWTTTCYVRHRVDPETGETSSHENCGIRIAEGAHRAYMTSFFRDPKAGACSVGIPPANLGIRLVREHAGFVGGMIDWLGF